MADFFYFVYPIKINYFIKRNHGFLDCNTVFYQQVHASIVVLVDILNDEIHKDIALIISDRRKCVVTKKIMIQTASLFTEMTAYALNTFSYISGENLSICEHNNRKTQYL